MQTGHDLSRRGAELGYGTSLIAFVVSALFFVDVVGEYFVNTSYLFALGFWYEFAIAAVAAAAGVILAAYTFVRRR